MTDVTLDYYAGLGDCWGSTFASLFDNNNADVYLGTDTTNTDRNVRTWFPFAGVGIRKDTVVVSATLFVKASSTSSATTSNIQVSCEAADNPADPTDYTDLLGRAKTTAVVNTTLVPYVLNTVYSYDCTAAVQEILNRAGWAAGNKIAVMIDDTDFSPKVKKAYSADSGGNMANLEIVVRPFLPKAMFIG